MNWTITTAASAFRQGSLTPGDLLEQCLAQIDALEPHVRAWVLVDRDRARADARLLGEELRRGHDRGVLHGIPMGIKDIIDVFDWPTSCGSTLWQQSVARQDAPVVAQLRKAGAVLMGKTVTTAYASFDPSPTRNPWNLTRTPGGSSSGSAAAVACGMCLATLGSQTGGSITRPASYCGVAACKPPYGYASTRGVLPLAHSMDHIGPMARDVLGVAQVLQVIGKTPGPLWSLVRLDPEEAPLVGSLTGMFDALADEEVLDAMEDFRERLADGIEELDMQEIALPAGFEEVPARHRIVMAVEAAQFHQERLRRHPGDYPPCITSLLEEGMACPAAEYARCKQHQKSLRKQMLKLFEANDVLICPATTTPAPDAATTGDPAFNSPWSYLGLPVVSFPISESNEGLPLGVQVISHPSGLEHLLRIARLFEDLGGIELGNPTVT